MRFFVFFIFLGITFAEPAFAQQAGAPNPLGVFNAWTAYTLTENGQKTCYMVARAHPGKGNVKRGPAWLTVTHRPSENSKDVISYTSGFNYKAGSDVDMRVGKLTFDLFTQKDTAWSRDAMTDHQIAIAIQKNAVLTVTGIPAARNAKPATDTVDLRGGSSAYHAISRACGVEPPSAAKPTAPKKNYPAPVPKKKVN